MTSNHTIAFTLDASTNWDAGDTLTITFDASFDTSGLASTDATDYDINTGTEETVVVAGCGATDEIEITSIAADVITFTACAGYTAPGTGSTITIEIGTNATTVGTGDTQIVNPGALSSYKISFAGTIGDTGSVAVGIGNDDQVSITATVDPILDFDVTDTTVALGTLSTSTVSSDTATMTASTNAGSGYSITVSGATLDTGSATIDAMAVAATSSVGSEQFGLNLKNNTTPNVGTEASGGSGVASAGYNTADNFKFATGETVASTASTSTTTTYTMSYIANIGSNTDAGSYAATHTYIATGNF